MKIPSLIISSLLVSGLSLALSTAAQARDVDYSSALHSGDHGYSHPKHYRSRHHPGHYSRHNFGHHYKRHHGHHDSRGYYGHGKHSRHYGRLNDYHSDRYRDRKRRHSSHRQHGDSHDRRDKRDRRDSHRHRS